MSQSSKQSEQTSDLSPHKDNDKPHHAGHRARLKERFLKNGPDALADYELLELLLFLGIPRRDVKPLAKDLIKKFGSLSGVYSAEVRELQAIKGLSDTAVAAIKTVQASVHHVMREELKRKPILNSWSRLLDYCKSTMAHEKKENFRLLFLNKKNELIADEVQQTGTVDHTPAYPREIMKRALELGATALILVHNHPSGDPEPSQADIDFTKLIIEAGRPLNIVIHDHLIVSRGGSLSMRNEGYI